MAHHSRVFTLTILLLLLFSFFLFSGLVSTHFLLALCTSSSWMSPCCIHGGILLRPWRNCIISSIRLLSSQEYEERNTFIRLRTSFNMRTNLISNLHQFLEDNLSNSPLQYSFGSIPGQKNIMIIVSPFFWADLVSFISILLSL